MFPEHDRLESRVFIDIYCFCFTVITVYRLQSKRQVISDTIIIPLPRN